MEIKNAKERGKADAPYRKWLMLFMICCSLLESGITGWASRLSHQRQLVLLFLGILYAVFFFTGLEMYRAQQGWFKEKLGDYKRLALFYSITSAVAVLFLYLPEFARPILLLGVGMSMAVGSFFGMAAGIFHTAVYALCGLGNVYVMLCDLLLLLCGCLVVVFLGKKEYIHWGILFLFQFTFGNIMVFSYVQAGQLELNVLIYGLCNGIISAFGAYFLYHNFGSWSQVSGELDVMTGSETEWETQQEDENELDLAYDLETDAEPGAATRFAVEIILSEEFELYQAVKEFSNIDYFHAKKVSRIAENCARFMGANPKVAAAGGFYYRLGRMEGEPYVENGVALARTYWFPEEIVAILEEYNGEQKLPSTVESAIVHIVDSIVGKADVLGKSALSSAWNKDMLVYQTMNENSTKGLYDSSGVTMNMFLRIRDYLIKEANLF